MRNANGDWVLSVAPVDYVVVATLKPQFCGNGLQRQLSLEYRAGKYYLVGGMQMDRRMLSAYDLGEVA